MVTAQEREDALIYGFGHLVSSYMTDAHSGDSGALALDVFADLGLDQATVDILETLAEEVHGNYTYTGEANEIRRKIESGEL